MKFDWIDALAAQLPGSEVTWQPEWEAYKYLVGGKMYAMLGTHGAHEGARPILTVKLPPDRGDFLRRQYEGDIIPGYYMNKQHWNSIYLDAGIPQNFCEELLREAYATGLAALPAKTRKAIQEAAE